MGTKNDKIILALKKEIEAKKKLLKTSKSFVPVTNCNLDIDGKRINIHASTKDDILLAIAKLSNLKESLNKVLPDEKLVIGGYNVDEWILDLTNKYNYLNVSLEKRRLEQLESKLHQLLSVDTKISIEIEDLKNQI